MTDPPPEAVAVEDMSPEELERFSKKVLADLDVKLARVRGWLEFFADQRFPSSFQQQVPELLRALDQTRAILSFVKVVPIGPTPSLSLVRS